MRATLLCASFVSVAAFTTGLVEIPTTTTIRGPERVYTVTSITLEKDGWRPELQEIRIEAPDDSGWYAGPYMRRFVFRGDIGKLALESKLVCRPTIRVRAFTSSREPIGRPERHVCSGFAGS